MLELLCCFSCFVLCCTAVHNLFSVCCAVQALAEAIRSVTEFNPDMSVERIECVQQIEDVKDSY